jgi:hypothetical protein
MFKFNKSFSTTNVKNTFTNIDSIPNFDFNEKKLKGVLT